MSPRLTAAEDGVMLLIGACCFPMRLPGGPQRWGGSCATVQAARIVPASSLDNGGLRFGLRAVSPWRSKWIRKKGWRSRTAHLTGRPAHPHRVRVYAFPQIPKPPSKKEGTPVMQEAGSHGPPSNPPEAVPSCVENSPVKLLKVNDSVSPTHDRPTMVCVLPRERGAIKVLHTREKKATPTWRAVSGVKVGLGGNPSPHVSGPGRPGIPCRPYPRRRRSENIPGPRPGGWPGSASTGRTGGRPRPVRPCTGRSSGESRIATRRRLVISLDAPGRG